jgi:flagellar motor switch protein FliG
MSLQKSRRALSGVEKAAILLIAVGTEAAAFILQNLPEEDIESVTQELVRLRNVEPEYIQEVVEEFYHMMRAQEYIAAGGVAFTEELLKKSLGEDKGIEFLRRINRLMKVTGFDVLKNVDPNQLLSFIQKEHPQTIAFVLTQLNPVQASSILADLPPDLQAEVVLRFASMERISPETIQSVESVLESRVDFHRGASDFGGVKAIAEILNLVGQTTERAVLSKINERAPELATEIKNLMFVFEDITAMDDRSIQKVLKEVDNKELALALKHVSEETKEKVFSNLSERASNIIKEEMDYMGPVRLKDVEEAQQRIVDVIRRLEEDGAVIIAGGSRAETMVE